MKIKFIPHEISQQYPLHVFIKQKQYVLLIFYKRNHDADTKNENSNEIKIILFDKLTFIVYPG